MKKVKIEIIDCFESGAYARIYFDKKSLHDGFNTVYTKDFKTKRGALGAAKRFCDEYGLEYEVIENES